MVHKEWATSTSKSTTGNAKRSGRRSGDEVEGEVIDPGKYDLVLHPSHLWLTIHESGPPDRTRSRAWMEANYAGTSFLTPTRSANSSSRRRSSISLPTETKALATVGYDDEGVSSQRWHLIKNGLFVDWQTTRDLAAMTGRRSRTAAITATVGAAFRSRVCRTSRSSPALTTNRSTI